MPCTGGVRFGFSWIPGGDWGPIDSLSSAVILLPSVKESFTRKVSDLNSQAYLSWLLLLLILRLWCIQALRQWHYIPAPVSRTNIIFNKCAGHAVSSERARADCPPPWSVTGGLCLPHSHTDHLPGIPRFNLNFPRPTTENACDLGDLQSMECSLVLWRASKPSGLCGSGQ